MSQDLNQTNIQTIDASQIFKLRSAIASRKKKSLPTDKLSEKLQKLETSSKQKTESIDQRISKLDIYDDLPIAEKANEIAELLVNNQVIIVAGETGCGKTTQLPKICLNAGFGRRGIVGHTQPRRVAATSVARRIAEESKCQLGELVGYSVRFNNKLSEQTRVKLMTDGILLSELEVDPLLSKYEVIIIDEAHERSLNIDFLLGFLKQILTKRPELKLIITSATIDPESFSKSFNNAPVVLVEGRSYPVEVRYRPIEQEEDEKTDDPLLNGITNAIDECDSESRGDILIFADGEGQIKNIIKRIHKLRLDNTIALPLYARLGIKEQQRIFESSHQRKIIVTTNVAETSLTVPGIIYVIDIGTARISRFSQRNKIQQLPVEKISQASAEQRKGRCGRVAPGVCIRLYSEEDFNLRSEFTSPEIKRTNLSSVVLKLKALQVSDVAHFPFMEKPNDRAWKVAFNSLFELGALDSQQAITSIGKQMAKLPVDPQLARILTEPKLSAVNEMLIFCALMSVREVRERPHDKQLKADNKHRQYEVGGSDLLTAINLFSKLDEKKQELSSSGFKKWCVENYINFLGWLEWRRVYFQLKESVESLGVKIKTSPAHPEEIHRALIPGFITHVFQKTQEPHYQGVRGLKVWLHPSSLYFKSGKPWLLSAEMIETEKLYARMNAEVKAEWIEIAVPHLLKSQYKDIHWRKKKGQVSAFLNQTMLGLPIVNNRLVNYSQIDPARCRTVFLSEGLADDQLNEDFPFLNSNRKILEELSDQEQRQRQNNIRIDGKELAAKYDEVLPQHIVSCISLKRWLKKDFKRRNNLLSFSIEELTQSAINTQEDYPSSIKVKGFDIKLSYSFAPGTAEDGVCAEIPIQMISQFSDRDFDWLVPGYLKEKILATIKVLPKPIRRSLIPLSETADTCYQALATIDQQGKRFIDELAKVLQRHSGIQIKSSDFDLQAIEPHLTMKFKTKGTSKLKVEHSIARLKSELKPDAIKVTTRSQNVISDWPEQGFSIETIVNKNSVEARLFRAFEDKKDKVVISEFSSREIAKEKHLYGVARLLIRLEGSELKRFLKSWPDRKQIERLNLRAGGFETIADVLSVLSAVKAIGDSQPVSESETFKIVRQKFKQNFREFLASKLAELVPLIQQREKLYQEVNELHSVAHKQSIDDIKSQLADLWSYNRLLMGKDFIFTHYPRYQESIAKRISRIKSNYPKEEQALEVWQDWAEWFKEIGEDQNIEYIMPAYQEAYWLLQEYRISLFAPGVKVMSGVSSKKLQKRFEQLEDQLADL